MRFFAVGHVTHPDPHMALALGAAQVQAQWSRQADAGPPTLGWLYATEAYAPHAEALLAEAVQRWPGVCWVGCTAVGIMACGTEYRDEPALALMLCNLPVAQFQPFNGRQPLDRRGSGRLTGPVHTAMVHADPRTPELEDMLTELAGRTDTGYLFGGLASSADEDGQTRHIADGVFSGGLSGVAFGAEVPLYSRVTQGCQPVGPTRRVTARDRNLVLTLDDQPALALVLADLGLSLDRPREALNGLRRTLVGLTDPSGDMLARGGQFGSDTRVRPLVGIDPAREGLAIGDRPQPGQQLALCRRDPEAARRDLVRICAELRDEVAGDDADLPGTLGAPAAARRIAGAVYVSCAGRGGPHFGAPSAEAQILRHALGDVPWVGFFAAGEIARRHLYGYTGVLTVLADG